MGLAQLEEETTVIEKELIRYDAAPKKHSLGGTKGKGTRRRVNGKHSHTAQTIQLFVAGMQPSEIAEIQAIPIRTVEQRLVGFDVVLREIKNLETYRAKKADIIEAAEALCLKSVVEKLPDATCREATYAYDRIYNSGRLERNLSTANISNKITAELTYCRPQLPDISK